MYKALIQTYVMINRLFSQAENEIRIIDFSSNGVNSNSISIISISNNEDLSVFITIEHLFQT